MGAGSRRKLHIPNRSRTYLVYLMGSYQPMECHGSKLTVYSYSKTEKKTNSFPLSSVNG